MNCNDPLAFQLVPLSGQKSNIFQPNTSETNDITFIELLVLFAYLHGFFLLQYDKKGHDMILNSTA